MLLEDFQPRHVFAIDSAAVNFRIGLPGRLASHYHPRSDPRGAAQWIEQHATRPGDLVINGFPAASFYSARFDFAYTDIRHQRFRAYACRRGKVERWSNLPLLHDAEEIREQARSHDRVFLVLDREQFKTLRLELSGWKPNVGWVSDDGEVLAIILHNQYPS